MLEFCAAIPALNDDPVVVRLRAACADDAKNGDQRGIIDPTGRGITRRPWVEGVPPPPRGGDEGGSEKEGGEVPWNGGASSSSWRR